MRDENDNCFVVVVFASSFPASSCPAHIQKPRDEDENTLSAGLSQPESLLSDQGRCFPAGDWTASG